MCDDCIPFESRLEDITTEFEKTLSAEQKTLWILMRETNDRKVSAHIKNYIVNIPNKEDVDRTTKILSGDLK